MRHSRVDQESVGERVRGAPGEFVAVSVQIRDVVCRHVPGPDKPVEDTRVNQRPFVRGEQRRMERKGFHGPKPALAVENRLDLPQQPDIRVAHARPSALPFLDRRDQVGSDAFVDLRAFEERSIHHQHRSLETLSGRSPIGAQRRTASTRIQSSTVCAIGPTVSNEPASGKTPSIG
jgi:hypothetical protein